MRGAHEETHRIDFQVAPGSKKISEKVRWSWGDNEGRWTVQEEPCLQSPEIRILLLWLRSTRYGSRTRTQSTADMKEMAPQAAPTPGTGTSSSSPPRLFTQEDPMLKESLQSSVRQQNSWECRQARGPGMLIKMQARSSQKGIARGKETPSVQLTLAKAYE